VSKSTGTEISLQNEPHTATSASRFVEVAVPLHVAPTFTYRLTPELTSAAKPGARIKVPFGRKLITAYIVALHDTLPPDSSLAEADLKDAASLVDLEPVCTPEILQLARWTTQL